MSAEATNNVAVINGATDTWVSNVAMGGVPGGVGVHTGTNRIYVGVGAPVQGVRVIDGTTDTVVATVPGMNGPNDVTVDSVQNRAYVANQGDNTLKIINTATNTVLTSTAVGNTPTGVAVDASLNHAYTTNNGASSVSVVNVNTGVIEEPDVGVQLAPTDADFNSANGFVYVTNSSSCSVSVLQDLSGVCQDGASSHWWNSAWGRRRPLTLDNATQLSTLSNFPVLIKLDSSRIDYTRTQNAGQDLRFVDADDLTLLDHEIELWNEAGTSYVWVRVPTIIGTSRRTIYMYFDNAGAPDGQNPTGVWNAGYSMVQHLEEAAGTHLDSTSNANNSTAINVAARGPAVVGQIDGADSFLGGTQNIDVGNSASLNVTAAESLTVEAWIRTAATGEVIVSKEEPAVGEYQLWVNGTNAAFWTNDGVDNARANSVTVVNDNQFHYLVGTFDRATSTATIFVDGVSVGSNTNAAVGALGSTRVLRIGEEADTDPEGGFNFNGIIDEVRVSKVLRSGDWIRAQHLSMTDRFVTFGAEKGTCNLRSIGVRPNYGTAQPQGAGTTVTTFANSRTVSGAGTTWRTSNRGRGDSIAIGAFVSTILSVDSQTQLTLVHPFTGAPGAGQAYAIARKFAIPRAWEDCIDGGGTTCGPDPVVPSPSLVADNRGEIGIVYNDGAPYLPPGAGQEIVQISGSTTDVRHDITLTVDPGNRHNGILGAGVVFDDSGNTSHGVLILDQFVTVEWLEIKANDLGANDGVQIPNGLVTPNQLALKNCLIHNLGRDGLRISDTDTNLDVYNNFIFRNGGRGINVNAALTAATAVRIYNNTVFGNLNLGIRSAALASPVVELRNNISHSNTPPDLNISAAGLKPTSRNNLASDATGTAHSPAGGGINSVPLTGGGGINFVNTTAGSENLHLQPTSAAVNTGTNLSVLFDRDIDGVIRLNPWEIGADDTSQTTAVTLLSFEAQGSPGPTGAPAVALSWETASELSNLGFHLYRSASAAGPWERLTQAVIPGLGSSPTGQRYSWLDTAVAAGARYYYELEDIETTGRTERHGPVSAVAEARGPGGGGEDGGGSGTVGSGTLHGGPGEPVLRVVERGSSYVVLELVTPGFTAVPQADGTVRLVVPGFEDADDPGAPAIPVRGTVVDARVGRRAFVSSVRPEEILKVSGLRLSPAGARTVVVGATGTVRAGVALQHPGEAYRRGGFYPRLWARVMGVAFQGETKKARLELSPLRYDPQTGTVALARRLTVRVEFSGPQAGERSLGGSRGRRPRPEPGRGPGVAAQLVTKQAGLYRVRFEDVFGASASGVSLSKLGLSRQGQPVPYHVEPERAVFGPGASLFFVGGGDLNPNGDAVYELKVSAGGVLMPVVSGAPSGPATTEYEAKERLEQNRFYQAGLLEATDLWQWDLLVSSTSKSYSFTVSALAPSFRSGQLRVWLQGASDFTADPDHHLRALVNGTLVGEVSWDGKREQVIEGELGPRLLQEGTNTLTLQNVGDTAASSSLVFLNRFEVSYPRLLQAQGGRLEGSSFESGEAVIAGLGGPGFVVDTTATSTWLRGPQPTPDGLAVRLAAGRRYLAMSQAALLAPVVRRNPRTSLRRGTQADWLLVGPREFLSAAKPLADLRRGQGLHTRLVAIEDVNQEFGHGEAGPSGLKAFLEHAYHNWPAPSYRYLVLLGDSTYDPKDYLQTHVQDRVPFYPVATSYLWTASDPAYGAVNGEDLLPDVAVGRLPAANAAEAAVLVGKVVAFEEAGRTLGGRAVLVADNADAGGPFEADADEIAAGVLSGREVSKLYLRDLGPAMRAEIKGAFDAGPGLVSYMGHGATAVWASENVFNNTDVPGLSAQAQQPLLLTLNCLNGFFHFPPFDSLSEAFLKAEGKGAIAAFSPSGLSLDQPAHLYHKALLAEIASGRHARLGDAFMAAQARYAESGAFPELIAIYHLFGDPALRIR